MQDQYDPLPLLEMIRVDEFLRKSLFDAVEDGPAGLSHSTTREMWERSDRFDECNEAICRHGYKELFHGYHAIDIEGHTYLSEGDRGNSIFRVKKDYSSLGLGDCVIPSLEVESLTQNRVEKLIRGRVLQIGISGNGCVVKDFKIPALSYTCIDTRESWIQQAQFEFGAYDGCFIRSSFEDFYRDGYDTILSLYGQASQIPIALLNRIPFMLRRGGIAVLMFKPDRNGRDLSHESYEQLVVRSWYDMTREQRRQ